MSPFKIEQITGPLACGEGPHWDSGRKQLYLVDIPSAVIVRHDPATKKNYHAKVDAPFVSFILPVKGTNDKFVVGLGHDLAVIKWDGVSEKVPKSDIEVLDTVETDRPSNRFNDGKCDPTGRVLAGTMGGKIRGTWENKQGALYELGNNKKLRNILPEVGIGNGLTWSKDQKTFYYADTLAFNIVAYDYDVTNGNIANRRVIFDLKKNDVVGDADGMTTDQNGHLWIALYGGHQVICVDPSTGKIIQKLPIPGRDITSVTFAGDNLDELIVTSAFQDLSEEERKLIPYVGSTYRVTGLAVSGFENVAAVI